MVMRNKGQNLNYNHISVSSHPKACHSHYIPEQFILLRSFFPPKEISSPEGTKTPVESPNPMSTSVGSSSPMPPKRTSTSATLAMTQDAIRQLVADNVAIALKELT
ncbi:hypothetical protein Tco_1151703 [Tanacetum coccineum]